MGSQTVGHYWATKYTHAYNENTASSQGWPLLAVSRFVKETLMVYWSEKLMCTQLNEVPEGKRFNWVLCFLNEPFPGWAKSDHLLLVNSHLALRDNPYPNTQSATISSLIISGDILLWFDLLDKAVKKVLLASLNLLPLFTKHLPRISAICGMMSRDHWDCCIFFYLEQKKELFAASVGFSMNYYFWNISVCTLL